MRLTAKTTAELGYWASDDQGGVMTADPGTYLFVSPDVEDNRDGSFTFTTSDGTVVTVGEDDWELTDV